MTGWGCGGEGAVLSEPTSMHGYSTRTSAMRPARDLNVFCTTPLVKLEFTRMPSAAAVVTSSRASKGARYSAFSQPPLEDSS